MKFCLRVAFLCFTHHYHLNNCQPFPSSQDKYLSLDSEKELVSSLYLSSYLNLIIIKSQIRSTYEYSYNLSLKLKKKVCKFSTTFLKFSTTVLLIMYDTYI